MTKFALWAVAAAAALAAALFVVAGRDERAAPGEAVGRAWAALVEAASGRGADEDDDDSDEPGHDDDDEDEDEDEDEEPLPLVDGVPAVRLDPERQALAGVETARLEAASFVPTVLATAEAVDIQPLAALRDAYRERYFEAEAADIAVAAARREHERLAALYREDADIAEKDVSRAETVRRTARAERNRVWAGLDSLRARAARAWGPVLAEWAFAADDARFAGLASGADSLLRAALPAGRVLRERPREASFVRDGAEIAVAWLSPAPRTTPGAGESHFFVAADEPLPAGLRVGLRVSPAAAPAAGLALPQGAVVRGLGRDWAYARVDERHFVRREVSLDHVLPDGRYLAGGLEAGVEVAVAGAMVLFAEEFRSQIRDEDDDD